MGRITVMVAPHPDDETLYGCAYAAFAADRGDRMILIAVTDGGASGARPSGWTVSDLMSIRRAEQETAWRVLTNGTGEIVRWGLPDGGVTQGSVRARVASLHQTLVADGSTVEWYGACNNGSVESKDHYAVGSALKLGVPKGQVLRVLRDPRRTSPGGSTTTPTTAQKARCVQADNAYKPFGHYSVASAFTALRANQYVNTVIPVV